jgi:ribose-phosphate pyrophosphokinase
VVIVSPDLGRLGLATRYADELHTGVAVVHKRRLSGRQTESLQVVGEVRDRPCLIVDDMITTGGTIAGCIEALLRDGARREIRVAATHGLFMPGADERLRQAGVSQMWVTDTLPQPASSGDRVVVPVADMIATAIRQLRP